MDMVLVLVLFEVLIIRIVDHSKAFLAVNKPVKSTISDSSRRVRNADDNNMNNPHGHTK